jgi:hypothetical protein
MVGRPAGGRPTTAATTASTLKPPALLGFDEIRQGCNAPGATVVDNTA